MANSVLGWIQAATQHRGSMSSHNYQSQSGRIHAESLSGRLRSNSNIASTHDESSDQAIAVHPVEERARTAVLPPIMVSRTSSLSLSNRKIRTSSLLVRKGLAIDLFFFFLLLVP